ncbi:hypothetical protein QL285_004826 [Trifolium repens]|nr:hypothetical protein QL285_004826 [Trifolium repens]
MSGSETSSIENSSGLHLARCGCDQAMKMRVANTIKNPRENYGDVEILYTVWKVVTYLSEMMNLMMFMVGMEIKKLQ